MAGLGQVRRDSKHRVLFRGESQRSDGKYIFKYQSNNKVHILSSVSDAKHGVCKKEFRYATISTSGILYVFSYSTCTLGANLLTMVGMHQSFLDDY